MIKEIIKKWYFWLIISLFTIIVPLAISCIYLIGYKNSLEVNTLISAGDAFLGYGALLSFVGSTFLGAIAIWQNKVLMKYQENEIKKNEKAFIIAEQIKRDEYVETDKEGYFSISKLIEKTKLTLFGNNILMKMTNYGKAVNKNLTIHYYIVSIDNIESITRYIFTQNFLLAPGQSKYFTIPAIKGFFPSGFALEAESIFGEKMYGHFCVIPSHDENTISDFQVFADISTIDSLIEKQTNMKLCNIFEIRE